MITKSQKKKILSVIGHRYVAEIQAYLKKNNIVNKKGEVHSSSMITNVMNGVSNKEIETAIYKIVEEKLEEINRREDLLRRI